MAPPKGFIPWNKGKTNIYSKEVIESNRQKHLGKKLSEEHKLKIKLKMQQRRLSEEHKRKIGINTKIKLTGKKFIDIHGLMGSMELKAKIGSNSWPKRNKGNFPQSTLEKKRLNVSGNKNPMYGIRGENHPSWLGGKKLEPYDKNFNKWFKQSIRERDGYKCVKCGITNEEHKRLFQNQSIHIHHIDYNKKNTCKENCCCLCTRCNSEVNFNRDNWTNHFKTKLNEKNYI